MFQSQSGYIESVLEGLFPSPGFFLEIGCWDGELISQTAYLERALGWRGICVDPFARNFEKRSCRVVRSAITTDGEKKDFVKVSIDRRYGGDVSYFSGFMDKISANWPLIQEFCDYQIVRVPCFTPMDFLVGYEVPRFVEFLSIDTEGSEYDILQGIDHDRFRFGLVMYEHNEDDAERNKIARLLEGNGYTLHSTTRIDDIYVSARRP